MRTGALGDLLVGLASLAEVLKNWPEHRVTVAGSSLWTEILEPGFFPQIDQILAIDRKSTAGQLYECSSDQTSWVIAQDRTSLYALCRHADVFFNARVDSIRQAVPAFFAQTRERWGSAPGALGLLYNLRAPHDGKDPLIHERDVPLLMMDEAQNKGPLAKRLSDRQLQSSRIQTWKHLGLPRTRKLDAQNKTQQKTQLIINPTSSRREKAWPVERFQSLLNHREFQSLILDKGLKVILVGTTSERSWLDEIVTGVNWPDTLPELETRTPKSIRDLSLELDRSVAVIANTSSVQFLAASCSVPVLTLMGRARPEIWGPVGPRDLVVQSPNAAQFQHLNPGSDIFKLEAEAYRAITTDQVVAALLQWTVLGPTR